jgi:hypothetical protein
VTLVPGYRSRVTARGYRVVELDAVADPTRDTAWLEEARRRSPSEADFQREVMRNWNITSGDAYYPEFATIGRPSYEWEPPSLIRGPVYRGWDFGWRAPVCVWFQYAPKSDRAFVLREFTPRGISAHHFLAVCRHFSGTLAYEELEAVPREWVDMTRETTGMPKPPWFPYGTRFEDLAGPEVNMVQSIAARDPREANLRGVWSQGGIELGIQAGPVKARADVLRRLLYPRDDGWPGILISPSCSGVLAMLDGGLAYRRPTPLNPKPEEPRKDGFYDNIHDALTYGLVGVVPSSPPMVWAEGEAADENVGWAEAEGRDR